MTDIVDKRRYLIGVEIAILIASAIFAILVTLDLVTAPLLLVFMFIVSTGSALRCACLAGDRTDARAARRPATLRSLRTVSA